MNYKNYKIKKHVVSIRQKCWRCQHWLEIGDLAVEITHYEDTPHSYLSQTVWTCSEECAITQVNEPIYVIQKLEQEQMGVTVAIEVSGTEVGWNT